MSKPLIFASRGVKEHIRKYDDAYPKKAERIGAHGIELDVTYQKMVNIVVIHDETRRSVQQMALTCFGKKR